MKRMPWIVAGAALATAASGCTVGRIYRNVPLRADPSAIVEGTSTKGDVLRLFGPPNQINHQTNGDAFVYLYQRENWSTFRVQDPILRINWFTYTRQHERRDTLLVLFDFTGLVRGVAISHNVEDMPVL